MSNLLAATSMLAVSSNLPPVSEEVPDYVEARILYNPFTPREVQIEKLDYREGLMLSDYLEGLPEDASWMVFHNGVEVEPEQFAALPVAKGDRIALLLVPQGDAVKSILKIALVVAGAVVGAMLGGVVGAAIGAAIGGLVGALLLMPRPPKQAEDEGKSYGIDGAKNSSTEGIPFPVVYGEFRCAGNFADVYTENVGDTQYLYLRSILNDGEIEGVYDIELNEQPIENFQGVQTDIKKGTATQDISSWFGRSIVQKNKSVKLTTTYTTHKTTQPVDMVRFDLMFPKGLVSIDKKKGTHHKRTVQFEMQYRPTDANGNATGSWVNLDQTDPRTYYKGGLMAAWQIGQKLIINARAPIGASSNFTPAVEYRPVGATNWTQAGTILEDAGKHDFMVEPAGNILGGTQRPYARRLFQISPANQDVDYEIRGVNGAEIDAVTTYPKGGSGSGTVSDNRARQIRASFTSGRVARGYYEVSIRRTTTESTDEYILDEVYLTDVAEIDCDPMTLRHTAYLGLKVKLSDQLNQIPQVTARVKGCLLQEYDAAGNPTVKRWSNNPAWIALDILLSEARGAGLPTTRIDFPAFVALAEYCTANSISFNGVFDTGSNLGDALRQVLRVGHAVPIPFGTRISVAIDKPRNPVQLFSSANITGNDFQVTYLAMNDRANEFEVSYFDKTDRNKQKNIKYVDPKAVTYNEVPRKIQLTLQGVDNADQAKKELWRMVYSNRLLVRTVSFSTSLESISMLLGDVALIQHPLIDWTYQGRVLGNTIASTTQVDIDQAITLEAGQTYSIMVRHDVLDLGSYTVNSKVGNKLLVPTNAKITQDTVKRVTSQDGTADVSVYKVEKGATYDTLHLDDATDFAAGQSVKLYNLDVIEERNVSSVTALSANTTRVTLASALSKPAGPLAVYVLGKVTQVRRPYVLTGISGDGLDKRRLSFVEYNEGVYAAPELDLPTPVARLSDMVVDQVRGLMFDYEVKAEANRSIINCRVHWNSGHIINYGGADVYLSLNGGAERFIGTTDGGNEYTVQLSPSDDVEFRVVAKNVNGLRAPLAAAPAIAGTLDVAYATLDAPQSLGYSLLNFEATGKVRFVWTAPADTTGIQGYEFQYKKTADTDWIAFGSQTIYGLMVNVPGLEPGTYHARVRSISATSQSTWFESTAFSITAPSGSLYQLRPQEPGANVTEGRISSGITGQTAWATYNGDSPTTYSGRVQYLASTGEFSSIDRITNRRINLLNRADGVTGVTEAAVVTSLGTAAAITNQGALATQGSVTWLNQVTGNEKPDNYASVSDNMVRNSTLQNNAADWGTPNGVTLTAPTTGDPGAYWHATASGGSVFANNTIKFPLPSGADRLFISANIKGGGGGNPYYQVLFYFYNEAGTLINNPSAALYSGNTDAWVFKRATVTIPARAATYTVAIRPQLGAGLYVSLHGLRVATTENTATVGAVAGVNLTNNAGSVTLGDNDIITSSGTAAAITGQGALATVNAATWSTQITGTDKPESYATASENLIRNATLRDGTNEWSTLTNITRTAPTATDPGFYWNVTVSGGQAWANNAAYMPIPAGTDKLFASANVRGNGSGYWRVLVYFYDENNTFLGNQPALLSPGSTNAWLFKKATVPIPQRAVTYRVLVTSTLGTSTALSIHGVRVATTENAATLGAQSGVNLSNNAGNAFLGDNDIITSSGTASAISGQTAWATYNGDSPTVYSQRVAGLDTAGNLSGIDRITNRRINLLRRADGTTAIADADVLTSLGTASAIANQTAWATYTGDSPSTYASRVAGLDTSGNLSSLNRVTDRKLTLLYRADGTTAVTEAAVVTAQGTASAITNQTAWATYAGDTPTVYSQRVAGLDTSGNLAGIDRIVNRRLTLLQRADGATAVAEADVVTSLGTAAAITGQSAWATYATTLPAKLEGIQAGATAGTNLIQNSSFITDTTGWTLTTAARVAPSTGDPGPFIRADNTAGTDIIFGEARYSTNIPIHSGQRRIYYSYWQRFNGAPTTSNITILSWDGVNSAGTFVGAASIQNSMHNGFLDGAGTTRVNAPANRWVLVTGFADLPVGVVQLNNIRLRARTPIGLIGDITGLTLSLTEINADRHPKMMGLDIGATASENRVVNGEFLDGLTSWTIPTAEISNISVVAQASGAPGRFAARCTGASAANVGINPNNGTIALNGATKLWASAWARASATGIPMYIQFSFINAASGYAGAGSNVVGTWYITPGTTWTKIDHSIMVPAGATHVQMIVTFGLSGKTSADWGEFTAVRLATTAERATVGATAGTDIFRTDGTTAMTQAEIRTAEGVAASITNQTAWATYGGDSPTVYSQRVAYLDTAGNLAALNRITDRKMTYLQRADGTTALTEAMAITSLGTASGISGQTAWATYSGDTPTVYSQRVAYLDTAGNLSSLSRVTDRKITTLQRDDGTTAVTEAAVVTAQGTASGITNQGALATKNAVNLGTADISTIGSIPPTVPDNSFTYSSTTNSVTISWPAMTVYRADGTTIAVASGSQAITGLSSGVTYRVYPYFADNGGSSASITFVTTASAYGTPAYAYSGTGRAQAAAQSYLRGNVPMGSFNVTTTSSGTGGGGGGGIEYCMHPSMVIGDKRAGELKVGDLVPSPSGLIPVLGIARRRCSNWIVVYSHGAEVARVTPEHGLYRAGSRSDLKARDLKLGDWLMAEGDHIQVTGLELCHDEADLVGIDVGGDHLHYAGAANLLNHNGTAKP
ncbi:hypothetical protein ACQKOE_07700 [Novosphingobium sp. NPDC080210]|uniref:hypothetical protein n=1 Tax=Novosphingobium sp. NPDC080210 TaxID=3390596 RepID=UPI003D07C24E